MTRFFFLLSLVLLPSAAHAFSMSSKWPDSTIVDFYLKEIDWPESDRAQVRRQMINTASMWNRYAGVSTTFRYAGTTTVWSSGDGINSVGRGACGFSPCYFAGQWLGQVSGTTQTEFDLVLIDTNTSGTLFWSPRWGEGNEFIGVMAHEFGHAMGLNHSTESGAVMLSGSTSNRFLGADDIEGLRTHATLKYTMNTTRLARVLISTDGATWANGATVTNAECTTRPAIVYGSATNPDHYLVAYSRSNVAGDIRMAIGDGFAWTSQYNLGSNSYYGPALAFGKVGTTDTFAVAFTEANEPKNIMLRSSTTGTGGWTSAVAITSTKAAAGPALSYNSSAGVWILSYVEASTSRIRVRVSTDLSTWSTDTYIHDSQRAFGSVGLACRSTDSTCTIGFTDTSGEGFLRYIEGTVSTFGFSPARYHQVRNETSSAGPGLAWSHESARALFFAWQGTNSPRGTFTLMRGSRTVPKDEWHWTTFSNPSADGVMDGIGATWSPRYFEWAIASCR